MVEQAVFNSETRCGFVAVIGAANAGKSTFMNKAIGKDISIVTHKAQTTRVPVCGVMMRGKAQIIFVDTAGLFQTKPRRFRLERDMINQAWQRAADADIILWIIDAVRGVDGENISYILNHLRQYDLRVVVVLNKIDLVSKKSSLLGLVADAQKWGIADHFFMVSALKKDGISDILQFLEQNLPSRPFLFSTNCVSDYSAGFFAAEITRKILLENLHQELPYRLTVATENMEKRNDALHIHQTITMASKAHQRILLKRGLLQRISMKSRLALEKIWDQKICLFLHAKISKKP